MSTKPRILASNVLLLCSFMIALGFWYYGAQVSQWQHEHEKRNQAWRNIIDHSSSAIIVVDVAGRIVQWSAGAERMLGWSKNLAEGSELSLILPPERYESHKMGFYSLADRGRLKDGGVLQVVGYVLTKQGKILHVSIRITAVSNGHDLFVAQLTPADEIEQAVPHLPPPDKMQYAAPDIQEFRN